MRKLIAGSLLACGVFAASVGVSADTRAPNRQLFTFQCGGVATVTVSPVYQARAGQLVGATGVGVLQRVTLDGEVLFEQPSADALRASALTTCSFEFNGAILTLELLMTPQHGER